MFVGLGLLFVTLKLLGVIAWSWPLVTLPFWGPWLVIMFIYIGAGVVHFITD